MKKKYPWGKETFQLTRDYLKKKSDLKKQKEVFDEKQKASYALFGFSWAFMIWIYETFSHIGEFAEKSMDEPFPIPRILRWHTIKSDKIIEGDPFKYKGKFTENVHPYIIRTILETKMDYMITFEPYTDEVKNNVLDGLKKELKGVTVLTSNEDSDDDGDLGGNPIGVRVGDDDFPSTFKDAARTSSPRDLHKRVVVLEEAMLDIAAYIREKKIKMDERQHERMHVDLRESERNEEREKMSKMNELASVVVEEENEEKKLDDEEDKSQDEGGKVAAAQTEEEAETDEQEGEKKIKNC
ncbi:hypothetical protein P3S68_020060 [Capsicum galapagoense]